MPGHVAAITIQNNTGRVLLDLNGRTLSSSNSSGASMGVWVANSPNALITGNRHTRSDSGTWGATVQGFDTGIAVFASADVSISSSGVANGGLYVRNNGVGLAAEHADRLYVNSFSFSGSTEQSVRISNSDSPTLRSINVDPAGGEGVALYHSPDATISGASGRVRTNHYGLALYTGSDDASITSWAAHRAHSDTRLSAGIYVAAENATIDHATFNQTGSPNTCDIRVDASVVEAPYLDSATIYQRASGEAEICGTSTTGSTQIIQPNRAPLITAVTLPTTATISDVLTCSLAASDADGDTWTSSYAWSKNGSTRLGVTTQSLAVHASGLSSSDRVTCTATATDPSGASNSASASTLILNTPPVLGLVTLGSGLQVNSTAVCSATAFDVDGDNVTLSYRWTQVNTGTDMGTTSTGELTLTPSQWSSQDVLRCEVTAFDGIAKSAAVRATGKVQ